MLAVPEDGKAVAAIVKLIGKAIPSIAIDGIEQAELEYEERRRRGPRQAARSAHNPPARNRDRQSRPKLAKDTPRHGNGGSGGEQAPLHNLNGSNVTPLSRPPRGRQPRQHPNQPAHDR